MEFEPALLADDFPDQTEADWLRLVDRTLKGEPYSGLTHLTPDRIEIKPLYGPHASDDALVAPAAREAGDADWDIRARVQAADPVEANRQLLEDLAGGAASALIAVGVDGVQLTGADALAQVIDGVVVEWAPVALDAGFAGPVVADWLALAAKASPQARLAFHLDPLSAFARAGRSPGPFDSHIAAAAATAARSHGAYPKASLFLASGGVVHEAGGSDAQELAFMLAAAAAYAQAGAEAGLTVETALARTVLGVSVDVEYFSGVAKVRAARLLWAQLVGACGLAVPAVIEARSSRRMLSRMDAPTNLLRLTAANFAAAVGGADAIVLDTFTQPLGRPADLARRQARNTQLVLMQEAHVARVRDPARGAWSIEDHTRQLAHAAWRRFQEIESQGGLFEALKTGRLAADVARVRDGRQAAFASGAAKLLGVNLHPNPSDSPQPVAPEPSPPPAAIDVRLPGADDRIAALAPVRWAEPFEEAAP